MARQTPRGLSLSLSLSHFFLRHLLNYIPLSSNTPNKLILARIRVFISVVTPPHDNVIRSVFRKKPVLLCTRKSVPQSSSLYSTGSCEIEEYLRVGDNSYINNIYVFGSISGGSWKQNLSRSNNYNVMGLKQTHAKTLERNNICSVTNKIYSTHLPIPTLFIHADDFHKNRSQFFRLL
ncbi:hypothetical protein AGLY_009188 [Aphis glycines]|uniref:Uncharacterized protein n=1 Tax=Aphis glycines TaxID=307491 RepID=A0A6G0TKU6_APHGL|nr:hypothetical protein AGLY_009188 [Aphis glycines]